jgi:hypothetical protein
MKYFVVYDVATGEIKRSGFCPDEDLDKQAIPPLQVIEGQATYLDHYVKNGQLIEYTPEQSAAKQQFMPNFMVWSNESFTWIDTRQQDDKTAAQIEAVTNTRNGLLDSTDWIVIRATDQGVPIPEDWRTYRQALRDIDKQPGYPWNVIWPTPPVA